MNVDITVYGYITDGGAYHPACIDIEPPDGDHDQPSALFSYHDEDPHGLTCDGCYEYIFAPLDQHAGGEACDYGCADWCGDDAGCWLHYPVEQDEPVIAPLDTLWGITSTGHPAEED